jgi:Ca2+-binding EF-hand superfamily protein
MEWYRRRCSGLRDQQRSLSGKNNGHRVLVRWRLLAWIIASLLGVFAGVSQAQAQRPSINAFLEQYDTDHDGTLSLEEIKKAAVMRFQALDRRHKGRLTRSQLGGLLTFQQFRRADKDKDRTIDQKEFLAVVEALFQKADADQDGTLDKKELGTASGKALRRLFAVRQGPVL